MSHCDPNMCVGFLRLDLIPFHIQYIYPKLYLYSLWTGSLTETSFIIMVSFAWICNAVIDITAWFIVRSMEWQRNCIQKSWVLLEQIYIFFFILASSFVLMLSVSGTHSSLLLSLPTHTHRYTLVCMDGLFMNCVYAHTNRCIRLSVVDTSFFVCLFSV